MLFYVFGTVLDSRCILTGVRYAYTHRCGSWDIVLDSRCILTGVRCCVGTVLDIRFILTVVR